MKHYQPITIAKRWTYKNLSTMRKILYYLYLAFLVCLMFGFFYLLMIAAYVFE